MSTKEISTGSTTSSSSSSSASSSKVPSASTNVVQKSTASYRRKKFSVTPTATKFGEVTAKKSFVDSISMPVRALIIISLVIGGIGLYYHLTRRHKDEEEEEENTNSTNEEAERHVHFENAALTDPSEEDAQPSDESMDLPQTP
jgi:hypothetical protein